MVRITLIHKTLVNILPLLLILLIFLLNINIIIPPPFSCILMLLRILPFLLASATPPSSTHIPHPKPALCTNFMLNHGSEIVVEWSGNELGIMLICCVGSSRQSCYLSGFAMKARSLFSIRAMIWGRSHCVFEIVIRVLRRSLRDRQINMTTIGEADEASIFQSARTFHS